MSGKFRREDLITDEIPEEFPSAILYGWPEIMRYLRRVNPQEGGYSSNITNSLRKRGLPVCRSVNGFIMTSTSLIDYWIVQRGWEQGYGRDEVKIRKKDQQFWKEFNKGRGKEKVIQKGKRGRKLNLTKNKRK